MALNFQICEGLIEMAFHGNVVAEDVWRAVELLREAESRLEVSPDRITDLSDANFMALATEQLSRAAQCRNAAPLKNKVKSAIISPQPEQFGLARVFQTYNQNPLIEIKLFRDSASAHQWLGRAAKTDGQ